MSLLCSVCAESLMPLTEDAGAVGGTMPGDPHATPCGHLFHHDCIKGVLAHTEAAQRTCPDCRAPLRADTLIKVYLSPSTEQQPAGDTDASAGASAAEQQRKQHASAALSAHIETAFAEHIRELQLELSYKSDRLQRSQSMQATILDTMNSTHGNLSAGPSETTTTTTTTPPPLDTQSLVDKLRFMHMDLEHLQVRRDHLEQLVFSNRIDRFSAETTGFTECLTIDGSVANRAPCPVCRQLLIGDCVRLHGETYHTVCLPCQKCRQSLGICNSQLGLKRNLYHAGCLLCWFCQHLIQQCESRFIGMLPSCTRCFFQLPI